MTNRYHFQEYREVCNQIEEIEIKLEPIRNKLYGLKPINYSDTHVSPIDNRLNLIARKDSLESKLSELKAKERELYKKHIKEIAKVQNSQYRRVLRCIYLMRMSYADIAEVLKTSESAVRMMRSRADKEFVDSLE